MVVEPRHGLLLHHQPKAVSHEFEVLILLDLLLLHRTQVFQNVISTFDGLQVVVEGLKLQFGHNFLEFFNLILKLLIAVFDKRGL